MESGIQFQHPQVSVTQKDRNQSDIWDHRESCTEAREAVSLTSKKKRFFPRGRMLVLLALLQLSLCNLDTSLLEKYEQVISKRFTYSGVNLANWEQLPVTSIQSLHSLHDDSFLFHSNSKLFLYKDKKFSFVNDLFPGLTISSNSSLTLISHTKLSISVINSNEIFFCEGNKKICQKRNFNFGQLNDVAFDQFFNRVVVGTSNGIFLFEVGNEEKKIHLLEGKNILKVAVSFEGKIAASSDQILYR